LRGSRNNLSNSVHEQRIKTNGLGRTKPQFPNTNFRYEMLQIVGRHLRCSQRVFRVWNSKRFCKIIMKYLYLIRNVFAFPSALCTLRTKKKNYHVTLYVSIKNDFVTRTPDQGKCFWKVIEFFTHRRKGNVVGVDRGVIVCPSDRKGEKYAFVRFV